MRQLNRQTFLPPARRRLHLNAVSDKRQVHAPLVQVKRKLHQVHKQPRPKQKTLLKQRRRHHRLPQRFPLHLHLAVPKQVARTDGVKVTSLHKNEQF